MSRFSPDKRHFATGSGALSSSLAPDLNFRVTEIRFHLSAPGGSESFTATLNSTQGAAHDAVLFSQDMNGASDAVVVYDGAAGLSFQRGDTFDFAFTNGGGATFGLEVIYREEV